MKTAHARSPSRPTPGGALRAALERPRYEVLPLNGIIDDVLAHVPRAVKITVTASPNKGLEPTMGVVETLASRGYTVVPHLAARLVRDRAHLEEVMLRLRAADVRDVFVIAGDARQQAGEFADAAGLLSAMGEVRDDFRAIGISGYPESHQFISDETTIEAMFEKAHGYAHRQPDQLRRGRDRHLGPPRPRARGTLLPIWIGVPGAVDNRKLLRTSLRIGLGASARFLRAHRGWLRAFARRRRYMPTELLHELAPSLADPAARIGGIHVYTFNELERTDRWRREFAERLTRQ